MRFHSDLSPRESGAPFDEDPPHGLVVERALFSVEVRQAVIDDGAIEVAE